MVDHKYPNTEFIVETGGGCDGFASYDGAGEDYRIYMQDYGFGSRVIVERKDNEGNWKKIEPNDRFDKDTSNYLDALTALCSRFWYERGRKLINRTGIPRFGVERVEIGEPPDADLSL